jgi:hypothetical protein
MNRDQHDARRAQPSRLPILLSAVFPGAGQAVQRRWPAACVVALGFGASCAVFLWHMIKVIVIYYELGLEFRDRSDEVSIVLPLAFFALSLAVYLANVFDVYAAYRRMCLRRARARLEARQKELEVAAVRVREGE